MPSLLMVTTVLYTVTDIDLQSEARRTNIFKLSITGGDPVQLTTGWRKFSTMVQ